MMHLNASLIRTCQPQVTVIGEPQEVQRIDTEKVQEQLDRLREITTIEVIN